MHDFLAAVLIAILTALTALAAIAVLTILVSSCCVDKVKCMVGADFEDYIARTNFCSATIVMGHYVHVHHDI